MEWLADLEANPPHDISNGWTLKKEADYKMPIGCQYKAYTKDMGKGVCVQTIYTCEGVSAKGYHQFVKEMYVDAKDFISTDKREDGNQYTLVNTLALPCCMWNRYAIIRCTDHWDENGNCIVTEGSLPDHPNFPLPKRHFRLHSNKFLRLTNVGNDLQVTEVVWLDF